MKIKIILKLILILGIFIIMYTSTVYATHFYDTLGTIYEAPVERLADLQVVSGVAAKTYNAEKNVTRAEFAKLMVEATLDEDQRTDYLFDDAEIAKFKDVAKDAWYYDYVVIAVNKGYMIGFEDNTFRPDDNVTYEQISKMVLKALGHNYISESNPKGWQVEYVDKMYELLLFKNTDFTDIKGPANRGNCATIIWNMLREEVWKRVEENKTTGFLYVSTGKTLFENRFKAYVLIKNATINNYYDRDGQIYVYTTAGSYRLFDQSAQVKFTQTGGVSDLILKRCLFPDLKERLEVIDISTDIGYSLYSGTVSEFEEEGYRKNKIIKTNNLSDYVYLLKKDDEAGKENVRAISLDTSTFFIVDKIDCKDEVPKEYEKPEVKYYEDKYKELSESERFAYVYDSNVYDKLYRPTTKTITINEDDVFSGDAVLFKNNERVLWSEVKKGDILTRVDKNTYFVTRDYKKQGVLTSFERKNGEYTITLDDKKYDSYELAYCELYNSDVQSYFFKQKDNVRNGLIGKRVEVTFDFTDRIVNIKEIEPPVLESVSKIARFGIFEQFKTGSSKSDKINRIKININGNSFEYSTSSARPDLNYGDLVSFEFEEDSDKKIKNISKIKGTFKVNDDFSLVALNKNDFVLAFKGYESGEYNIFKIDYSYEVGEYKTVKDYTMNKVTVEDVESLKDVNDIYYYALKDKFNDYYYGYVINEVNNKDLYYGYIKRIYKEEKNSNEYSVVVQIFGGATNKTKTIKAPKKDTYTVNEFFSFRMPKEDQIEIVERYSLKALGYYKDLTVDSTTVNEKGNASEISLEDGAIFDISNWKITTKDKEYDLNDYVLVLLTLKKDGDRYYFSQASEVKQKTLKLKVNDKIAIDEVDGAVVIYRGYEE